MSVSLTMYLVNVLVVCVPFEFSWHVLVFLWFCIPAIRLKVCMLVLYDVL